MDYFHLDDSVSSFTSTHNSGRGYERRMYRILETVYQSRIYTATLFALQYVIPLITITGAYIMIGIEIGRAKKRHDSDAQDRFGLKLRRKEDLQIIKMMGIIVILFAVFMLPIQLAWFISDFGPAEYKKVANVLLRMADIAAYLHACVNPIIYGTITKFFRRQYIRYLKSVFVCNK